MPLKRGKSRKVIGQNIETEMQHGKPYDVARAIALNKADAPKAKSGHKKSKKH